MKAPKRLSGSRIAVGVASVGLTVGAFSLYSVSYTHLAAGSMRPRTTVRSSLKG